MKILLLPMALLVFSCSSIDKKNSNWPQAGGPNKDYTSQGQAPDSFSVASNKNIDWKIKLPEGGQSGIAIHGDKAFLTTLEASTKENPIKKGSNIQGHCIDLKTKKILWSVDIPGTFKVNYLYGFSDSTTPSPLCDGSKVWFYNASGTLACYDLDGKLVWDHKWAPIAKLDGVNFPFNKQFEPMISGDLVYNMEPFMKQGDPNHKFGWNYIFAYHKNSGELAWISNDALTHYNTPFVSNKAFGKDTILIGRGGHHKVPEDPRGYSMIDAKTGQTLWNYTPKTGMALYNSSFNDKYAIWLTYDHEMHVIDPKTGLLKKTISLVDNVDARLYDEKQNKIIHHKNFHITDKLGIKVFPAWFSNILIDDKLYFMCFGPEKYKFVKNAGPVNSFVCVDLKTNKVSYLQVPTSMKEGGNNYFEKISSNTINHRDLDIASDKRSKRDGWSWNFNANPICVEDKIYFTLMNGRVYVFDASAENFNASALLSVSDLGTKGSTWSLSTPSYAGGKLYFRTLKHLVSISEEK